MDDNASEELTFSVIQRSVTDINFVKAAASHVLAALLSDGYKADYVISAEDSVVETEKITGYKVTFLCK